MNYEKQYWKLLDKLNGELNEGVTSAIASCEFEVEPEFSFKEKYQILRSLEKECIANGDYETFSDKNITKMPVLVKPTRLEEDNFIRYVESGGDITSDSLEMIFLGKHIELLRLMPISSVMSFMLSFIYTYDCENASFNTACINCSAWL